MKKKALLILACGLMLAACSNQTFKTGKSEETTLKLELVAKSDPENETFNYFMFDSAEAGYQSQRSNVLTPTFYIYAGNKTKGQADSLVAQLDMADVVETWASNVYVIPPMDGEKYTEEDATAFIDLVAQGPVSNVKVIGLDDGATFVNNLLAPKYSYLMAGVLTVGGEVGDAISLAEQAPAYIAKSDKAVVTLYAKDDKGSKGIYQDDTDSLQKVVVSDKEGDLDDIFDDAWEQVFSQNYRMHNDTTEFYNANAKEIITGYGLEPVVDFEKLGIAHNQMEGKALNGQGSYTWYEYVPETISKQSDGSAPLIVTLHGFGNDPRLQGDTSGWVELAAKEGAILVSPEWQEKENNFAKVDGLGEKGVLDLVNYLKKTYPQIDSSRIYLTGLSAGGSKTALWGAKHPDVFAAAASVSAPGIDKEELTETANNYSAADLPYLYIVGDHDFFQMVPVDGSSPYGMPNIFFEDPNVSMFEFIQAYQKINQLPVSDKPDLNLNPYFGIELENQDLVQIGKKEALAGSLVNDDGRELIHLVTIKDLAHWNYRPEADYIWEFFSHYSRDVKNGESVYSE